MRMLIEDNFQFLDGRGDERNALTCAQDLVDEFLRFVRANDIGNDLVDEIELPHAKARLVDAFCRVVAAERRPDVRSLLIKAGLTLAQYRPGLGSRIRVRPGIEASRSDWRISATLARRFELTLMAAATDRVALSDILLKAVRRSLN